ncbi:ABC transporter permease [Magnetospirillum sulfuroxidans]|uniref:ABC transporter permease n=1 Tax=Magnetospirillum sulfuroxidans TaxID=611300 RepID=A0ABS5I9N4_9PROT|nr:FtsX-like permease family protein [Magnetospirillum sulfuroxidans]MBR9971140.1 ABC transporter permease [Magnetospirillum sulfuroxidans]
MRLLPPAATSTVRLAVADFVHEWRVSACLVLALAAVLAPLLVLFGLKSGIVTTMRDRLLADPRNLEVMIVGSYRLEPSWFAALHSLPETGFLMPRTRSLAASLDLIGDNGRSLAGAEMVPSALGDPLLRTLAPPGGQDRILLSHSAAQQLGIRADASVTALVSRTLGGERQVRRLPLKVVGILPEAAFGRDAAFVSLDLLVATEDYRDGRDTPMAMAERPFSSARLFARSLDGVAILADRLRAQGMEVRTRADDIELVKAVDRTLGFIFAMVAGLAVGGYLLSLAASLWANVDRKRRELALMRLVGFPPLASLAFPAIQAGLIALSGATLSAGLAFGVAYVVNVSLAANLNREEFVCLLRAADLAIASGATLTLALIASTLGGYRAARIDPAESLRDI